MYKKTFKVLIFLSAGISIARPATYVAQTCRMSRKKWLRHSRVAKAATSRLSRWVQGQKTACRVYT